jgi:hypothetical protein
MDEVFFSYNKQRKSKIATGLLKGAPQDEPTALSRIYKEETIPSYIDELDDEILKLTKEHSNPNKIKSELYKIFNDPKYTKVPEGVEAYNVFFNPKEKRFNFRLAKANNRRRSESFLNQKIAVNMMKSVEGDLNYDTAMAVKKFYLDENDLSPAEKSKLKKFRKQYNLSAVESGGGGFERKSGQQVNSPWLDYSKNLKFNIGKKLKDYQRFDTQATYLENVIKTLTRPEDVRFFEKELTAVRETQKNLIPSIRKEFPGLLDGVKINNEHKIAKALVDEGTVPLKYLTQTTPTPSFFNAIKYKEFDKPLIDLVYKYNDALPKDRAAIKTKIENLQKNFNNKTKVGGKGYLDSVKFTFGPKGVRAKDTTPTFRKGDFASQLTQNIKHSNAYLTNTGKKSIVIGGMAGIQRYPIDKLIIKPPRNFEAAVQALGCRGTKVRVRRVEGGKINTTDCYQKGLEKIRNKQVTDPVDARNMMRVAKASTTIAKSGTGRLAAFLGPAGIGADLLFEGAVVGNEVLKGKPFNEAWGRSFLSYLGPNRQDPDKLEMLRYAGTDPKAQSYVQDVNLENEFYENLNLLNTMRDDRQGAYTDDDRFKQLEKTSAIYNQIADKYSESGDPLTDIGKQTGSEGPTPEIMDKESNFRAFQRGQEIGLAREAERAREMPFGELSPARIQAERAKKITDIYEDGEVVGQRMKPQVQAQGILDYNLLQQGLTPGIAYMAEGGLTNLTRTVAPQSGPNSKGLESLRKYATKRY